MPERLGDRELTIQDVFEAVGEHASDKINDDELRAIGDFRRSWRWRVRGVRSPRTTRALAKEFLGLGAMGTDGVPAEDPREGDVGYRVGQLVMDTFGAA